jgi:hypothetical protein
VSRMPTATALVLLDSWRPACRQWGSERGQVEGGYMMFTSDTITTATNVSAMPASSSAATPCLHEGYKCCLSLLGQVQC